MKKQRRLLHRAVIFSDIKYLRCFKLMYGDIVIRWRKELPAEHNPLAGDNRQILVFDIYNNDWDQIVKGLGIIKYNRRAIDKGLTVTGPLWIYKD